MLFQIEFVDSFFELGDHFCVLPSLFCQGVKLHVDQIAQTDLFDVESCGLTGTQSLLLIIVVGVEQASALDVRVLASV